MDREGPSTDDPTERERTAGRTGGDGGGDRRRGPSPEPIEPEPVDPEHAAFVLLGAILTVAVLVGGL